MEQQRSCVACERGDGPWSLHHFDPGGCDGTFYGATFMLEERLDGEGYDIVRIEAN